MLKTENHKPNKNVTLFGSKSFKISAFFFLMLFIPSLFISLCTASTENIAFNSDGMNNLVFNIMKVPLSLLAAFLSFTGLLSMHLRSVQAYLQIESIMQKNKSDYYNSHREEFEKHVYSIFKKDEINRIKVLSLYKMLFPDSTLANFNIDKEACDAIIFPLHDIRKKYKLFHNKYIINTECKDGLIKNVNEIDSIEAIDAIEKELGDLLDQFSEFIESIGFDYQNYQFRLSGKYDILPLISKENDNCKLYDQYADFIDDFYSDLIKVIEFDLRY